MTEPLDDIHRLDAGDRIRIQVGAPSAEVSGEHTGVVGSILDDGLVVDLDEKVRLSNSVTGTIEIKYLPHIDDAGPVITKNGAVHQAHVHWIERIDEASAERVYEE